MQLNTTSEIVSSTVILLRTKKNSWGSFVLIGGREQVRRPFKESSAGVARFQQDW